MVNITSQVCSEVYDIIYHMEEELFNKIPRNFTDFIKKNMDENYIVNIDYSKSINDQELLRGTRVILSLIYRDYLCSEDERNNIIEQDKEALRKAEEELREKYNSDNLFKNKHKESFIEPNNEEIIENNNTALIKYKESFLTKFKNFIFKILHINK